MYKLIKDVNNRYIIFIEGVGHFNLNSVSYISELEELCDGVDVVLYFTIDNVKISKVIYDSDIESEFRDMYNFINHYFIFK